MQLVSIIIAIYNTESYLHRCIDSVINQTYKNLEIILVDDGSTDNSSAICDEYARKDSRVKCFHQENQGSALSRKFAITQSHGDFVLIVDSDDWIESTMVEKMLFKAIDNNFDVVWCDVMIHTQNQQFIHHLKFVNNPKEMLKAIYQGKVPGWFWNKLIHKSLLEELIAYKESVLEDIFFSTQLLLKSPRMGYIAEPLYNYNRINSKALTVGKLVLINGIPNIRHSYKHLVDNHRWDEFKTTFSILILRVKIDLLTNHRYSEAQSFYPFANSNINSYPINSPYSYVYWLGLNLGFLGRIILRIYFFSVSILSLLKK